LTLSLLQVVGQEADDYFVFLLSDANLQRYRIRPEELGGGLLVFALLGHVLCSAGSRARARDLSVFLIRVLRVYFLHLPPLLPSPQL
jgi:hypothetical protein